MIVYADNTALDYWRWEAATKSTRNHPQHVRNLRLDNKPESEKEIIECCRYFAKEGETITILLKSKQAHRHSSKIRFRTCQANMPLNSFYKLWSGVYVISPELAFIRCARNLPILYSIKLGCDLTSNYVLRSDDSRGFSQCEPICTIEQLQKYLAKAEGVQGIKKARQAMRFVIPAAASPREIELALILTLPKRLGGYGLPTPILNSNIKVADDKMRRLERSAIFPDLLWAKKKVVVEYESTQFHSGEAKFVLDSQRRNDLRHLGYDVTTVTNEELNSIAKMDRIANNLRLSLGIKKRPDPYGYGVKQVELRETLKKLRNGHPKGQKIASYGQNTYF